MSTPVEFQRVKAELAALRESIAADIEAATPRMHIDEDYIARALRIGMQDAARIARHTS